MRATKKQIVAGNWRIIPRSEWIFYWFLSSHFLAWTIILVTVVIFEDEWKNVCVGIELHGWYSCISVSWRWPTVEKILSMKLFPIEIPIFWALLLFLRAVLLRGSGKDYILSGKKASITFQLNTNSLHFDSVIQPSLWTLITLNVTEIWLVFFGACLRLIILLSRPILLKFWVRICK